MTGVFPSLLKTAKVVPVLKRDSTFDYSNYRSFCYQISKKYLKNLCINNSVLFSISFTT